MDGLKFARPAMIHMAMILEPSHRMILMRHVSRQKGGETCSMDYAAWQLEIIGILQLGISGHL